MPSRQLTDRVTVVGPDDPDAATPITVRLVPDAGRCWVPWHVATIAMLQAMADLDLRGRSVLDFGTGSGILAIVAAKMGAQVATTEIDPAVRAAAAANLAANGVNENAAEPYDVILANLGDAGAALNLLGLAPLLVATGETRRIRTGIAPGGRPLFRPRVQDIAAAMRAAGRTPLSVPFAEGWAVVSG